MATTRYTTWKSAIHACNVVLQAAYGIGYAVEWTEALFDEGTEDGDCDALMIERLLCAEAIACHAQTVDPLMVKPLAYAAVVHGRISLMRTAISDLLPEPRWAVVQGRNATSVLYGICVAPNEQDRYQAYMEDAFDGQIVILDHEIDPAFDVVAAQIRR